MLSRAIHLPPLLQRMKVISLGRQKWHTSPWLIAGAHRRPILFPTLSETDHRQRVRGCPGADTGVWSEDTVPQLQQVLHFHALLKVKYESKTGTGKQVMSLKLLFVQSRMLSHLLDTILYGPTHLVWNSSKEIEWNFIPSRDYKSHM